jgi:PAS domain S-box-containing protein
MNRRNVHKDEDLYRVLFESVHDGIYRSTSDGRILTANPALVSMLGYDSEEELKKLNIGKDIYADAEERNSFIKEIERNGRLKDTELVLRKKDGSHIIVLENSHAVVGDKGEILFYEGTLTEITERKHAEKALKESENRYHTLLETLQDGISLFDFTGKLHYFNSRKKSMLGYSDENELFKVNTFDMIHPEDLKSAQNTFQELSAKGSISNKQFRVVRKDGSWFWADFSATILKDSSGNPAFIMDSMRDITERKQSDEQLMVLKHSIDVHYDGAFWMDSDSRFVYVNDAACRATGYSRKELLGMHASRLNPQSNEEVVKLIWDKLRKDGSFTTESIHRRKNGSVYPVEIVTSYIEFGGKEYACGFARDITDRKKINEEMKLRLEQLRQIIDLVPSYIFAKDIEGKFILANKALAEVFGLSPEEIQGKDDSDYGATKEQVNWYRKYDREVIRKGIPVYIPEEQVLRKDGKLGWFQTVKIPYKHPGYDRPAILGVATEITDRKQAEDELRRSEKRFRKLFESHAAVKLLIDPETNNIIDANKAAAEFYGWPVSKLRKMNLCEISMSSGDQIKTRFDKASSTKGIFFESKNKLADGSIKDVEVFTSKIEIEGSYYIHSIVHDITEKKKILRDLMAAKEKAEESDRLKTAFLHNISHEIRTPMNAIVGFTSLLESKDLSEETRKQYIDIVFQSSNQLLSIISDIVDISNIETGHVRLMPVQFNLNAVTKSIYDQYHLRADLIGLEFTYKDSLSDEEAEIVADETKLVQIISNLLNNAFKFTSRGKIEYGYTRKGKFLEFYVKDSGKGIKQDYLNKIFNRFYQIENSMNQKTEGTGLGLSICKGYAELMGGKIWAVSKPGQGSTFSFTLPFTSAKREASIVKTDEKGGVSLNARGKTILIAEDDDLNFSLLKELLTESKINILRAVNGKEAVRLFREAERNLNLVFMDLKMPVMDGFKAIKEIRETNRELPVIALTAYVNDTDREKALKSGFTGYLTKPFTKNQIIKLLREHLL